MRLDVSWTDGGMQVHRIEDWPDEWGVPQVDSEIQYSRGGVTLVGTVQSVTYFHEPPEEEGHGYSVMVHIR